MDDLRWGPWMSTAQARATPNIALIKYWGKRDDQLILPETDSLSVTLDAYPTLTVVSTDETLNTDEFSLNCELRTDDSAIRVSQFLDVVRQLAGTEVRARIDSVSEIPTGAGLASSAAGFAALAVAASHAYDLDLDQRALTRLARRGSGSASRSIIPGLAVWHTGDDQSSFAEPISGPDFRMVVVTLDRGAKAVSSREAMRRTRDTSPYYQGWIESTTHTMSAAVRACHDNDFTRLGELAEMNAIRMHALIESAEPPIRYLSSRSIAVFESVEQLRRDGIECYATADAGQNVVVIVKADDDAAVTARLAEHGQTLSVGSGEGAKLLTSEAER